MEEENPKSKSWHIRKDITIGHFLTTIGLVVGGLGYINSIQNRVIVHDIQIQQLQKNNQQIEERIDGRFMRLENILNRIEDKLDRKADKK